jgi:hypothetical protein
MANEATGYNLAHLQVAPKTASPTFIDVNLAQMIEFNVEQDSDTLRADGGVRVTTFGAREGSGSLGFASAELPTIAALTGDAYTSSGTPGTSGIFRLDVAADTVPPPVILSAWVPNVNGLSGIAGMRVTAPNAQVAVPSTSFEQESWTEFEADIVFVADENNTMLIWETLDATPTFTSGVMPVNLEPPA